MSSYVAEMYYGVFDSSVRLKRVREKFQVPQRYALEFNRIRLCRQPVMLKLSNLSSNEFQLNV